MHVVVTGANGLVGRRLVKTLLTEGHQVSAFDRSPTASCAPQAAYFGIDFSDVKRLTDKLLELKPDVIINPAAMTDVDGCEREPDAAYLANVEGVATLCRVTKKLGSHLLHVSTDYVFDGAAGPYDVDAIPNPLGTYALTKHMGEETVRSLLPQAQWAIARTAVVYGWPNAGKDNFGSWLVSTLKAGKQVKLFNDQWVSPSLALNVAEMLAELGTRKLSGVWNTSGSEVHDRVTIGQRVCAKFGFDPALIQPSRMADVKLTSPRPAKSGLIVTKTAAQLKAQPLSLDAQLDRFLKEYQS